jgi:hypothetical protein
MANRLFATDCGPTTQNANESRRLSVTCVVTTFFA